MNKEEYLISKGWWKDHNAKSEFDRWYLGMCGPVWFEFAVGWQEYIENRNKEMNNKIKSLIMIDEGFRDKMYIDTLGNPTIGFGFNLNNVKLPIGLAKEWLDTLLDEVEYKLSNIISIWDNLTLERQYVLINMAYNLGIDGLNKFHGMIEAIEEEDYVRAEKEMADSLWDKQVPNRSQRLRKIMITGEFNE